MNVKKLLLTIGFVIVIFSLVIACSPAERPEAPATEPDYPDRPLNQPDLPIVEQQRRANELQSPQVEVEIDEDRLGDMRHQLEQRAPETPTPIR